MQKDGGQFVPGSRNRRFCIIRQVQVEKSLIVMLWWINESGGGTVQLPQYHIQHQKDAEFIASTSTYSTSSTKCKCSYSYRTCRERDQVGSYIIATLSSSQTQQGCIHTINRLFIFHLFALEASEWCDIKAAKELSVSEWRFFSHVTRRFFGGSLGARGETRRFFPISFAYFNPILHLRFWPAVCWRNR